MRQLLQRLDNGEALLVDAPVPTIGSQQLLVETRATLVSAGTERMLVEFGKANLIEKARQQPDKVRQVLDKMATDGIAPTIDAMRSKLAEPIALGYCNAGVVIEAGRAAGGFVPGQRVVSNAPHAEFVRVPWTLAARIPDNVSFEAAAFTPLASIGLQGVRLAAPTLGETIVVYGLGLIGLMTVQLLRANGCRVIGIDRVPDRLALAARFGAETLDGTAGDVAARVVALTGGNGTDAVLLTLAGSSDEPIREAARMARVRGRLVLVGVTGLDISRDDFYRKELTFQVSSSYGPGRYDPAYEAGQDYPRGFVRWTAQRNFEAILGLMSAGQLDPLPLVTHRFPIAEAPAGMALLASDAPVLGMLFNYPEHQAHAPLPRKIAIARQPLPAGPSGLVAGVIGAGNYATRTLLPLLPPAGFRLQTLVATGGASASVAGARLGFANAASETSAVLDDPSVNVVFILTRHDSHAQIAREALERGKHVFVEKPLALDTPSLDAVLEAARDSGRMLLVGFNRRFAPHAVALRSELANRAGPVSLIMTVNAGAIPADHWTQDAAVGGGRLVGEGCHFIDLARSLLGSTISSSSVVTARRRDGSRIEDVAHVVLGFSDGSTAAIHYLSSGSRRFPKERVEAFVDGRTLVIDNWRQMLDFSRRGTPRLWPFHRQDKGHAAEMAAWAEALRTGGPAPVDLEEVEEVARWTLRVGEEARGIKSAG